MIPTPQVYVVTNWPKCTIMLCLIKWVYKQTQKYSTHCKENMWSNKCYKFHGQQIYKCDNITTQLCCIPYTLTHSGHVVNLDWLMSVHLDM